MPLTWKTITMKVPFFSLKATYLVLLEVTRGGLVVDYYEEEFHGTTAEAVRRLRDLLSRAMPNQSFDEVLGWVERDGKVVKHLMRLDVATIVDVKLD